MGFAIETGSHIVAFVFHPIMLETGLTRSAEKLRKSTQTFNYWTADEGNIKQLSKHDVSFAFSAAVEQFTERNKTKKP